MKMLIILECQGVTVTSQKSFFVLSKDAKNGTFLITVGALNLILKNIGIEIQKICPRHKYPTSKMGLELKRIVSQTARDEDFLKFHNQFLHI